MRLVDGGAASPRAGLRRGRESSAEESAGGFGFEASRAMIDVELQGGVVAGANQNGAMVSFVLALTLFLGGPFAAGCSSPLPDADSPEAKLYARECGTCHVAYPPHMLKPAMWEMQMGRMALLRSQRGLPSLAAHDEKAILDYLTKHAG